MPVFVPTIVFVLVAVALVPRVARAEAKDLDGVINLNTAVPEMLELLPGIGPAKVHDILWYRHRHPFRTVDELVRIKGIGRKMVRRLRAHLAVSGPTTAHAVRRPISFELPPPPPPAQPTRKPGASSPVPNMAKTTAGVSAIARATWPPIGRLRAPAAGSREPRSRAVHCARPP